MQQLINLLLTHSPLLYWTQSLWRDEAFSVWIAQDSLFEAVRRTSGDFNPPLYYLLLNIWMKIFGRSEIALRGLSVFFFLLALIVIYVFAKKMFKSDRWATYTTLLTAFNPMLLYFAFELRMYSLVVLWSALSTYLVFEKKWLLYILVGALGLYTQPFMAFVLLAHFTYLILQKKYLEVVVSYAGIGLLYLPWVPTLLTQLKASGPMWMWPVDLKLVMAVLGNLYVGYEGTPGFFWPLTIVLSLLLIIAFFRVVSVKKARSQSFLFLSLVFVPLVLVLGISLIKPIYVHRYVIFVSLGEVFLLSMFVKQIKNHQIRRLTSVSILLLTFISNFLIAPYHAKVDIRSALTTITPNLKPNDVVYAATPLVYYETLYYTPRPTSVYLYNPNKIMPPRYVGAVGMPENVWATTFPTKPNRAFIIGEDGSFTVASD